MSELFAYSLAVSMALIPLYLVVRLCLCGLTFHRLTRGVMLSALAVSLLLPFAAQGAGGILDALFSPAGTAVGVVTAGMPMAVMVADLPAGAPESPLWLRALILVYSAGVVFFALREVWSAARLAMVIRRSRPAGRAGRWELRVHSLQGVGPFSFGRYILISEDDYADLAPSVITHESAHLGARHWADLLFADVVAVVCWYCPAAWLMRRDLSAAHEYEADEAVIASGVCAADYQIMLIKKAAGSRFQSIACCLTFKSTITKRVKMMLKPKSRPVLRLLAAVALPAVGLSLLALSAPAVANALSTVSDAKVTNNTATVQEAADTVVSVGQLDNVLVVGYAKPDDTAKGSDKNPLVIIDGEKVASEEFNSLDPSTIASVAVLKDDVALKEYGDDPRAQNGVIIVTTKPVGAPAPAVSDNEPVKVTGAETVFMKSDELPLFEGGDAGMMKFLSDNLRYPEEALASGVKGRTIVQFVVNTDGSVSDVRVVRSSRNESLDDEAVRLAGLLHFTKPAMNGGKPVRVLYTLPINFVPDNSATEKVEPAVEQMPVYEGGEVAIMKFLCDNLRFPEGTLKPGLKARAVVQFVINTDGSVSDVKVMRSAGDKRLDDEACRVAGLLHFASPAKKNGKPVRVSYTIPVTFTAK